MASNHGLLFTSSMPLNPSTSIRILTCLLYTSSIIEIGDGVIEVLATNGDTRLGGDDFDNRVTQWMIDEFKKAEGIDLSGDKMALQRLKEAAEKRCV